MNMKTFWKDFFEDISIGETVKIKGPLRLEKGIVKAIEKRGNTIIYWITPLSWEPKGGSLAFPREMIAKEGEKKR